MIIKLRLKLGSSADKRCVWLRWCAATAIWKQGFWQFSDLWSQIREVRVWQDFDSSCRSVRREQAGSRTDRLSRSNRKRGKNSPVAFFAVWQWHTIHWYWASGAAAITCSVFVVTKEISQSLWIFIHWCPFLWVVNSVDIWSFLSDVTLIFKTQQSTTSLVFADMTISRLLLLYIPLLKVITDGYTVGLWRLITAQQHLWFIIHLDPEVLWCIHFTDLLSVDSSSSFLWCFL